MGITSGHFLLTNSKKQTCSTASRNRIIPQFKDCIDNFLCFLSAKLSKIDASEARFSAKFSVLHTHSGDSVNNTLCLGTAWAFASSQDIIFFSFSGLYDTSQPQQFKKIYWKWFIKVDSGEKLGFQVTLMLTVFIYIEYLQSNIPVFDVIGKTPNLLQFYVTLILLMTLSLLGKVVPESGNFV